MSGIKISFLAVVIFFNSSCINDTQNNKRSSCDEFSIALQLIDKENNFVTEGVVGISNTRAEENDYEIALNSNRVYEIDSSGIICLNRDSLALVHGVNLNDTLIAFYVNESYNHTAFKLPLSSKKLLVKLNRYPTLDD